MKNPGTAYLSQLPGGRWGLWVSSAPGEGIPPIHTDLSAATDPGILPSLADRTAALARLGFAPAEDTWTWREQDTDSPAGSPFLVGTIPVRPAVDTRPGAEVHVGPGRRPVVVRTERRDAPKHNRGPVAAEDLAAVLGPEAAGWPALGLTVHHGGVVDLDGSQFRVFAGHRLIGFTTPSPHAPGGREYRPVDYTDREGLSYGAPVEGLPVDPLRAEYDALRAFHKPGDREYPAGPYVPAGGGR
ncbi:DUF6303 family protein [Streptomyces sp. NPDC127103]|uniref:DUF6303 family protein n=1 Tax=Streptomyces sp. NPDC127103 TaxID=3347139 RepID=UPI003658428E